MKKISTRILSGPSVYHDDPCACLTLKLSESGDLRDNNQKLPSILAVLNSEVSKLYPDASQCEQMATPLEQITEVTSTLLQGIGSHGRTIVSTYDAQADQVHLAVNAEPPAMGTIIFELAFQLTFLGDFNENNGRALKSIGNHISRSLAAANAKRPFDNVRQMQESLNRAHIEWLSLGHYPGSQNLFQVGLGKYQHLLELSVAFQSSGTGIEISKNKRFTQMFLRDLGFPVTNQFPVRGKPEAISVAHRIGYPLVLKTNYGSQGDGVICDIRNELELADAVSQLMNNPRHKRGMVLENYIEGNDYRVCIVNRQLLHVIERCAPQVIGDGKSTISELVEEENKHPFRGEKDNPNKKFLFLNLGEFERAHLAKRGLDVNSIPSKDQVITLRSTSNWSNGGTAAYVCEQIHPDNIDLAVRIAESLKIDILGVDMMTTDISRSYLEGGLSVIEVNHMPGVGASLDKHGNFRDEPLNMMKRLIPGVDNQFFPKILFTGLPDSAEDAPEIQAALCSVGYSPGVIDKAGMSVSGRLIAPRNQLDQQDPAIHIFRNQEADASIIYKSPADVIDFGMGTGGADVSVLLGSNGPVASQYWPEGFTWAQVLSLLIKQSRAGVVLNFDDPGLKDLAKEYRGQRSLCVVTVSRDRESIDGLLSKGFSVAAFHMLDNTSVELIFGVQGAVTAAEFELPSDIVSHYTLAGLAILFLLKTDISEILKWMETHS